MGHAHTPHGARALRVGLIAPPGRPVPSGRGGGTELVIDGLARGLARRGVEVVLFTTGDATCPVERRWLHEEHLGTGAPASAEVAHVEAAYAALTDVDLIHDHSVEGPAWWTLHPDGLPVVTTIHGRLIPELRRRYLAAAEHGVAVVVLSDDQRWHAGPVPVSAIIHHGIDTASVPVGRGGGGFVAFLGPMTGDEGAHRAVGVARRAGWPIVIAAERREPGEHRYDHHQVEALLGPDDRFVGEVGGRAKLDLLGQAAALVNPIRGPEPFGLVMIEALACGTPVVAFHEGAGPEIVRPGRTGYLCRDDDDMVARLGCIDRLDRRACRADAEARFSSERMVDDHLALYGRLLGEHRCGRRSDVLTVTV